MKRIMFFCIPAHGHHNPTLPVVKALVKRGHQVRYYSFSEFEEKIRATGADYIGCDAFLPPVTEEQAEALKQVATTEMTIVDLQTTERMNAFLHDQIEEFKPDLIVSDSVCFWGKLTARKYKLPLVVSTTTFAFNKYSSQYQKTSMREIIGLIRGSGRVKEALKALEPYGYHEKNVIKLVQNDNYTDTVVYATQRYQPYSSTFSKHYAFIGPSIFSDLAPAKDAERPLVYIALGTVMNEREDFYHRCIDALKDEHVRVLISCGRHTDLSSFADLPEHVTVLPYVDQQKVLSEASVFLTHCGMNSVSESLYMATPMVLWPQTGEQAAVARRARELGAGIELKGDTVEEIRAAVLQVLRDPAYASAAQACSEDFRAASGPEGAADFIESAPHIMPEEDRKNIRREVLPGVMQLLFWCIAIPLIILIPQWTGSGRWWIPAIVANVLFAPYQKIVDKLLAKLLDRS